MTFALPPKQNNGLAYTGYGLSLMPAVEFPRAPRASDINYPLFTLWRNNNNEAVSPDALGDMWYLAYMFINSGQQQAQWNKIATGSSGPALSVTGDDGTEVNPNASGNISLHGNVVANATHAKAVFTESPAANIENIDVQVGAAIASTDVTKAGLLSLSNAHFTVDSNGFSDAKAATAQASSSFSNAGIASFNNNEFTVDSNGFVALIGSSTPAIQRVVRQVFTTSGTYTPTTNMLFADVEVVGAGGGAGGCATTGAGQLAASGSGGGGGYTRKLFTATTIGASQMVTIGAGGSAGAAGANAGGTGGTTSFGTFLSATGGTGGAAGTASTGDQIAGGNGGVGTGGDFNTTGQSSSTSWSSFGSYVFTSPGGSSFFGGGAPGNFATLPAAAIPGASYGGGAAGGEIGQNTSGIAGAAGAPGLVIITEYIA